MEGTELGPVAKVPGGFMPGPDPRRAPGGVPARIRELRALFADDVPAARTRLLLLLESEDEQIAIQAVALAYAYGVGRPKTAPEDIEALLREQFSEAMQKLGQRLSADVFNQVLAALKR